MNKRTAPISVADLCQRSGRHAAHPGPAVRRARPRAVRLRLCAADRCLPRRPVLCRPDSGQHRRPRGPPTRSPRFAGWHTLQLGAVCDRLLRRRRCRTGVDRSISHRRRLDRRQCLGRCRLSRRRHDRRRTHSRVLVPRRDRGCRAAHRAGARLVQCSNLDWLPRASLACYSDQRGHADLDGTHARRITRRRESAARARSQIRSIS